MLDICGIIGNSDIKLDINRQPAWQATGILARPVFGRLFAEPDSRHHCLTERGLDGNVAADESTGNQLAVALDARLIFAERISGSLFYEKTASSRRSGKTSRRLGNQPQVPRERTARSWVRSAKFSMLPTGALAAGAIKGGVLWPRQSTRAARWDSRCPCKILLRRWLSPQPGKWSRNSGTEAETATDAYSRFPRQPFI